MELVDIRIAVAPYLGKLEAFDTAEEIKDFLVGEGVKAHKRSANSCAIAKYVTDNTGQSVSVGGGAVVTRHPDGEEQALLYTGTPALLYTGTPAFRYAELSTCTPAMQDFIRTFDQGFYPELVAE